MTTDIETRVQQGRFELEMVAELDRAKRLLDWSERESERKSIRKGSAEEKSVREIKQGEFDLLRKARREGKPEVMPSCVVLVDRVVDIKSPIDVDLSDESACFEHMKQVFDTGRLAGLDPDDDTLSFVKLMEEFGWSRSKAMGLRNAAAMFSLASKV